MKVTLSSVVTVLLTVAWYVVALILALTTCVAVLSVFHDFRASGESALSSSSASLGVRHGNATI
jgi:hypothetical protein